MKFGYMWLSGFREEVIRKCGRTTEVANPISFSGAFGSRVLKISWKTG